jgi:hypothetical protein
MPFPTKLLNGAWRLLLGEPKREPLTSTGETMSAFFDRTLHPGNWPRGATCDDCAPEFKQTKAEKFNV